MPENFETGGSLYRSREEAEKSALEFKIDQLEEGIENLRSRIGNIENSNLRRPLEIQLDIKLKNLADLRDGIAQLQSDIDEAEKNNGPLN